MRKIIFFNLLTVLILFFLSCTNEIENKSELPKNITNNNTVLHFKLVPDNAVIQNTFEKIDTFSKNSFLSLFIGTKQGKIITEIANKDKIDNILNNKEVKTILGNFEFVWKDKPIIIENIKYFEILLVNKEIELDNSFITIADPELVSSNWEVKIQLDKKGSRKFAELTGNNINRNLAVIYKDKLITAPNIISRIPNGRIVITLDYFTEKEVLDFIKSILPESDKYIPNKVINKEISNIEKTKKIAKEYMTAIENIRTSNPIFDDFKNFNRLGIDRIEEVLEVNENKVSIRGEDGVVVNCYSKACPEEIKFRPITNEMILVKGGSFMMGSELEEDTKPVHEVIVNDFYISKYEITQNEFQILMDYNPSGYDNSLNLPVQLSWDKAIQFCNKKSKNEKLDPYYLIYENGYTELNYNSKGYRLPTEAEWEYASRGGLISNNFKYSGSNDVNEVAWFNNELQIVGRKLPNELGIYDMTGNIEEWCWDYYVYDYYAISPKDNPTGGTDGSRVIRGGRISVNDDSKACTFRRPAKVCMEDLQIGLRLVKTK